MSMEHNPHDVFFRSFFSHTDTMQALLQHILPPDLRSEMDLNSLEIEPVSYNDFLNSSIRTPPSSCARNRWISRPCCITSPACTKTA